MAATATRLKWVKTMNKIVAFAMLHLMLWSDLAVAVPLETFQTFTTDNPLTSRRGPWAQLMARGTGTDDMYVIEVDPVTGQIPVSAAVSFSNDTDYGVVGTDTLRTAAQIGNATGAADFNEGASGAQTLRVTVATDDVVTVDGTVAATQSGTWNVTNISGTVSLPTGAATEATLSSLNGKINNSFGSGTGAVRTAAQIGNASGLVDYNAGNASAQTIRTVIATDQSALPASQSGTWNITNVSGTVSLPTGASTEATLSTLNGKVANGTGTAAGAVRVVTASDSPGPAGRAYSDSSVLDYGSNNVTSGAWVQVDASTAGVFNLITIFSSCANALELGTGAGAAETRVLLIPPGGLDAPIPLAIPAGTRLSVRAISTSCTTGNLILTGLN